jgi:hypothetical protein
MHMGIFSSHGKNSEPESFGYVDSGKRPQWVVSTRREIERKCLDHKPRENWVCAQETDNPPTARKSDWHDRGPAFPVR